MTFKGPGGYGRIVNIIMNLVLCAVFSFFMLWTTQHQPGMENIPVLTPLTFAISYVEAFCIGFFVADIIPVFQVGTAFANALHLKNKVARYFATVIVIDLIVTSTISFAMVWINLSGRVGMGFVASWASSLPIALLIGYVVQLVIMKPAMSFATRVTGFDPEKAMAGGMPPQGMGGPGAPGGPGMPGGLGAPGDVPGQGVGGPGAVPPQGRGPQ